MSITFDRLATAWYPLSMGLPRLISLSVAAAAGLWMAVCPVAPVGAARSDFVGSKTCGTCHSIAFKAWTRSAHAKASESLASQVKDRRCLACHATGDAPAGRAYGWGVGCESCHGSGAGYAANDIMRSPLLADELGLRDLSTVEARTALCRSCHRDDIRLTPFDVDSAWKRIAH